MTVWRDVIGQDAAVATLQRAVTDPGSMTHAWLLTGPGETADFEFTPRTRGNLRLEVKTLLPGWSVPVTGRVR